MCGTISSARRLLIGPLSFFILNFLLLVCGFTLLVVKVDIASLDIMQPFAAYGDEADEYIESLRDETVNIRKVGSWLGLIAAVWLGLVGLLGMACALFSFKCLLCTYLHIMIMSFLLVVGFSSVIFFAMSGKDEIHQAVKEVFESGLKSHFDGNSKTENRFESFVDRMQVELSCCGIDNYTEFRFAIIWIALNNGSLVVPPSCCNLNKTAFRNEGRFVLKDPLCTRKPTAENSYMYKPCYSKIEPLIESQLTTIRCIASVLSVLMVILIAFAAYLFVVGGSLLPI